MNLHNLDLGQKCITIWRELQLAVNWNRFNRLNKTFEQYKGNPLYRIGDVNQISIPGAC